MQFNVAFATDVGKKRTQNQDNGAAYPEMGLFVVADGMGGHQGGEIASSMVVDIVPQQVKSKQSQGGIDSKTILVDSIKQANQAIFERAQKQTSLQGMGTTTTAMIFHDGRLLIGHVGDSRCYFISPESIWQLTRDHSLVQEKLKAGLITREQMKTDRMKNVITRSVGFEPSVDVEVYQMSVQAGDTFLICSDGLSGLVDDATICEIVKKHHYQQKDTDAAVKALIQKANDNGGDDNVTVLVVQIAKMD